MRCSIFVVPIEKRAQIFLHQLLAAMLPVLYMLAASTVPFDWRMAAAAAAGGGTTLWHAARSPEHS